MIFGLYIPLCEKTQPSLVAEMNRILLWSFLSLVCIHILCSILAIIPIKTPYLKVGIK